MLDLSNSIQTIASSLKGASIEELSTTYLSGASSHKIELSNANQGGKYISSVLYLLQEKLSGYQMCAFSTESCRDICLGTNSGHGAMMKSTEKTNMVQVARLKRTLLLKEQYNTFMAILVKELKALSTKAEKKGVQAVFRFNGTSDLLIEHYKVDGKTLFEIFPEIQFYDYTKSKTRMIQFLQGKMATNYYLIYSYAPENESDAQEILALGGNVAVVFDEKATKKHRPTFIGQRFLGHEIITGDDHDLRFADPQGGYVVGLTRKGNNRQKGRKFFVNLDRLELQAEVA